jgi:hypothetical protein
MLKKLDDLDMNDDEQLSKQTYMQRGRENVGRTKLK